MGSGTSLGAVPREQKMLKAHLSRVIYHPVFQHEKIIGLGTCSLAVGWFSSVVTTRENGVLVTHYGVSNTHTRVSNTLRGVSSTQDRVSNTMSWMLGFWVWGGSHTSQKCEAVARMARIQGS